MGKRTVPFNEQGIRKLPADRPVLYKIKTQGGKTNYAGVAKRGRVRERLREHLRGGKDPVPGAKVQIDQAASIRAAETKEASVIARTKPPYNKQGE